MEALISTENLGCHFGNIKAVDGVSFSVKRGDVLGFLGPNGAGKSTTMKMLTGFLTPSFGTAKVGGYNVEEHPREAKALVGYLPENAPLYGENTVREFLEFISRMRSLDGVNASTAIERAIELTSLEFVVNQRIETLSKGYRRRVGLAQAILHDPQILILDEPTDGLDPNQKHEVRQLIRQMASEKCIVLSTHILEEVSEVCNRAIIIANGKIVADDTPDGLRLKAGKQGYISFALAEGSGEVEEEIGEIAEVDSIERDTGPNRFIVRSSEAAMATRSILSVAESKQWNVLDLSLHASELDEVFRSLTSDQQD